MAIMDVSKAFDFVPHQRLVLNLPHYWTTGKMLNLIRNFPTMTKHQVVLEGVSSSSMTVTSGVPHGAALGHLLFILYLNGLPGGISSQVRLLADICILYRKISTLMDCLELN